MPFKETETLELKKSTSELKEALEAISAMLNKHGYGEVIFGIEDDGKVVGQDIGKMTLKDISRSIHDHVDSGLYPLLKEVQFEGKNCISVKFSGNEVPYSAFGRAYMRVGDKNILMSGKQLQELVLHKNKDALRWDSKPCLGATVKDIDPKKLRDFLKKAGLEFKSVEISLRNLGLMLGSDGDIANAAILLFGKETQKFIPNSQLRCAVFAGRATFLDMKDYPGDLFYLVEQAEKYVLNNIHMGERIEGLTRIDVPEIDMTAIREAVINAFIHRDYYNPDVVHLAIYQDKVQIRSPGLLYGGLTLERMKKGGRSERRNELVVSLLQRIHFAEAWGRGIQTILEKEPKTTFEEDGRQFFAEFVRKQQSASVQTKTISSASDYQETVKKLSRNYGATVEKILNAIIANPSINAVDLAKKAKMSESGVWYNLNRLKKDGILRRVGGDRGGRWEIAQGKD